MEDTQATQVEEVLVLSKFEGEPLPENEFERIHIKDGMVVMVEKIEDGQVVSSEIVKEVD